jgi:hypothetical protein
MWKKLNITTFQFVGFFLYILDDIGEKLKTDVPGEILFVHCDLVKEDDIKVYLIYISISGKKVIPRKNQNHQNYMKIADSV